MSEEQPLTTDPRVDPLVNTSADTQSDTPRVEQDGANALLDTHDALLSTLIDDAFYGRPLIAVTGVRGAGKTFLAKRFAQQFANEAECIPIALSDFDNRDDFIKRLVTKLSPDSIEYVAESPLNTVVDYAGSLADQERLLVLIIDDAETLDGAFLETLYELIDEADEASLCCLLLGEPELKDAIERADPNGGVEDFTWFELPEPSSPRPLNDSVQAIAEPVEPQPEPEKSGHETGIVDLELAKLTEPVEPIVAAESTASAGLTESIVPPESIAPAPIDIDEESEESFDELLGIVASSAESEDAVAIESAGFDDCEQQEEALVDASDDEFDRDIDEWLEPDFRPSIGSATFRVGEELELDFGDDEQLKGAVQVQRGDESAITHDFLDDDDDEGDFGGAANKTGYLSATTALFQSLPVRLAAARNYWLAAGGLSILVLAIVVFWRIPDEPRSGVIELAAPLADSSVASVETTSETLAIPSSASGQIRRPATPERVPSAPVNEPRVASASSSVALTSAPATTPPPAVPQAREIPPRSEVLSEQAPPAAPSSAASSATAPASTTAPIPQRRESILSGSPFERQLLAAPAEGFSLQILGASSEANVKAFVERNGNGLRQTLGYYRAERAGAPWYIVAYGVFATRAEAEATLNRLPQALAASGPWVRSISAVQAEIRASR